MTTYPNAEMRICELHLGDVVRAFDGPWGTAVVKQIDSDGLVHFYRPYGHASKSCVYAGNQLICYSGLEEFTRHIGDKAGIFVYQHSEESDFELPMKLGEQNRKLKADLSAFLAWFRTFIGSETYNEINCKQLTALRDATR